MCALKLGIGDQDNAAQTELGAAALPAAIIEPALRQGGFFRLVYSLQGILIREYP
jgi:hypothetical protein